MPKINKEEYEALKALDSRAKSIVRQARGWLWVAEQPIMKDETGWYVEDGFDAVLEDDNLFHFIQWEDREPYNIAELIEEYEYSNEPEVLSQEWIDEHKVARVNDLRKMTMSDVVPVDELENLIVPKQEITFDQVHDKLREESILSEKSFDYYWNCINDNVEIDEPGNLIVPKQELPVIPKYVADWIDDIKPDNSLRVAFGYIAQRKADNYDDSLALWLEEGNSETFARAWLEGYEVEEEPLYYAKLKDIRPLKKEWLVNLTAPKYYVVNTRGLMFGEFILDLVGMKTEASAYTLKDWERHGINDSNADFVKVEELEE